MTTIAYKDNVIAYDSRVTSDITIIDDNCEKKRVENNVAFFLTGSTADHDRLIAAYFGAEINLKNVNANAMVADSDALYLIGVDEEVGIFRTPLSKDITYAIGSGADHALTAMDMGLSAADAVKMAAKRDTCTGGKIRRYKCK